MTLIELRKERAEHVGKMRNFLDSHPKMNTEDEAIYNKMDAELDKMTAEIARTEKLEATEKALDMDVNERIIDKVEKKPVEDRASQEYKDSFKNYIKTRKASNSLVEGTSADGGYLVPVDFERTLFAGRDSEDPIFELAGRLFLGTSEKLVPFVSSHATATIVSEGGSYGGDAPTFGQVTLHAYKFGTIVKATDELIADSAFDIEAFLAQEFGRAIGKAQASYFWTGTGSSQPQGVMNAAGAGVTTSGASISADDIINLYYSLADKYRSVSTFVMNDATVKEIRKLKLGTGEYLWTPGLNGAPDTILGRPLRTSEYIDTIASGKKVAAFGDFEGCYKIADRQGFEFKALYEKYADTGEVGFRGSLRSDGKGILASEGIKVLTMKA